jgi:hypothetical protein
MMDEAMFSPLPRSRRLLVTGSVRWVISGLDLREPLHADGVDLRDPVLERGALNFILDLAIPQGAFKGDELPLFQDRLHYRPLGISRSGCIGAHLELAQ